MNGIHEREELVDAASVGSGEGPEIVVCGRKCLAEGAHHIEIEEGVAVGFGAGELQGEASVGSDLIGDECRCGSGRGTRP